MPKDFNDWIDSYNKAKGWKTIVVPGGKKGAKRSTTSELKSLREESAAEELKLAKELGELDATIIDLVRKVRDEHRDLEKFRLENDLKIAQNKHKQVSAKHDIATELTLKRERLLKQMQDLDKNIRSSIKDIHGEIDKITMNPKQATPKGHKSRKEFDKRRDELTKKIDEVRDTPVTLRDPRLSETKTYNGISKPEYTLLHTLLLKADALADTGEADEGGKVLNEVADKLDKMAKARKGVILAEIVPDRNPEVAGPVNEAQQAIAAIRRAGLAGLADKLDSRLEILDDEFEEAKDKQQLPIEDMIRPHQEFAETCRTEAGKLPAFRKAVTEMGSLVGELRILGEDDRADNAEAVWTNHNQSDDIVKETNFIERRNGMLRLTITNVRDGLLNQEQVDPRALRKKLDEINKSVETMYKHHRDGTRKTQKDAKSQQSKDVKKDGDIPREALDELTMRLKMAEILLASNSVDAMKRAGAYLDEVEKFQTDVKDNSSSFDDMIEGIKDLRSDFTKYQDRYRPYLLDKRSELKIAVDAFDKDYKKQAPDTNKAKLKELKEKSSDIHSQAKELKLTRKKYDKEAKALKKQVEAFGKLFLSAKYEKNGKAVTGYWGQMVKDLADAHTAAEKHDKDGLTDAVSKLDEVKLALEEQRPIVEKRMKSGRDGMTQDEIKDWVAIRDDALRGQDKHEADEKARQEWKKAQPIMAKRLEAIKKTFADLKLDTSDIDLAIMDLDTLKTEQKAQPDYVAAMEKLEEMKGTATALENRAKALEDFKAEPVDKATKVVVRHLQDFLSFVDGFDGEVHKADPDADNKYDLGNLNPYLDLVREAVPDAAIKRLEKTATELAKDTSLSAKSRELRESALADVRLIMGRMRTSAAIKHFAGQTFVANESRDIALAALDRLQVKLLTALK